MNEYKSNKVYNIDKDSEQNKKNKKNKRDINNI